MTYEEARRAVARERETEEWLRSQDFSDIVMRIHELEDLVTDLESELEKREWVYLTEEEMLDIVDTYGMPLADAIEAKLKEKNT